MLLAKTTLAHPARYAASNTWCAPIRLGPTSWSNGVCMLGLMGMVLGLSLMFFITTIPFERLVLSLMRLIAPRLTYFAGRNVSRGKNRNSLRNNFV